MNKPTNVIEIVKAYLLANKYDGLYDGDECGCQVDDLAPCGQIGDFCKPGYMCNIDGELLIGGVQDERTNKDDNATADN